MILTVLQQLLKILGVCSPKWKIPKNYGFEKVKIEEEKNGFFKI